MTPMQPPSSSSGASASSAQSTPVARTFASSETPRPTGLSTFAQSTVSDAPPAERLSTQPASELLTGTVDRAESTLTAGFLFPLFDKQIRMDSLGESASSSSGPSFASSTSSSSSSQSSTWDTVIYMHGEEETFELLDLPKIHEWEFRYALDFLQFECADKQIAAGEKLPAMAHPASQFSSKSKFFSYLMQHPADLYIYLKLGADINAPDETGATLLHHAAKIGVTTTGQRASIVLNLLFQRTDIDFGKRDLQGNTAVHVASMHCHNKVTCRDVFPKMVKAAATRGFNFTTKGDGGHTILHMAALVSYISSTTGYDENLSNILKILCGTDETGYRAQPISNLKVVLDTLSDSGTSALYACVEMLKFNEALDLLKAGADPRVGAGDKTPMARIAAFKSDLEVMTKQAFSMEPKDEDTLARVGALEKGLAEFEAQLKSYLETDGS